MPDKFNLHVMRRLFNPQLSGKGKTGEQRRVPFKTTLSPFAQDALRGSVPTGKGKYASATIELGLRFLLALVGEIALKFPCEAMVLAVKDRKQLVINLRQAADYIESYTERKA